MSSFYATLFVIHHIFSLKILLSILLIRTKVQCLNLFVSYFYSQMSIAHVPGSESAPSKTWSGGRTWARSLLGTTSSISRSGTSPPLRSQRRPGHGSCHQGVGGAGGDHVLGGTAVLPDPAEGDGRMGECFLEEVGERGLLISWKDIMVSLIKWNKTGKWEPLTLTAVTTL